MKLSRNLRKILLVSTSILMLTSVGTGAGNLSASAKRYRIRATRRYQRPKSHRKFTKKWLRHRKSRGRIRNRKKRPRNRKRARRYSRKRRRGHRNRHAERVSNKLIKLMGRKANRKPRRTNRARKRSYRSRINPVVNQPAQPDLVNNNPAPTNDSTPELTKPQPVANPKSVIKPKAQTSRYVNRTHKYLTMDSPTFYTSPNLGAYGGSGVYGWKNSIATTPKAQKALDGSTWAYVANLHIPGSSSSGDWQHPGWIQLDKLSDSADHEVVPHDIPEIASEAQVGQQNDTTGASEAMAETLRNVNADRASVGIAPIQEDAKLNQLARERAKQIITDFSHGNSETSDHQAFYIHEAPQFGIPINQGYSGENLAESYKQDPKAAADDMNTALWTNEKGATPDQDGGHRKNIRNPHFTKIGIGVAYSPEKQEYFMSQNFFGQ